MDEASDGKPEPDVEKDAPIPDDDLEKVSGGSYHPPTGTNPTHELNPQPLPP